MSSSRLPFNPPGKKLGQYKFHHEIGRGNYGVVYLASDESGKKFAIKSMKKEIFKENNGVIGNLVKNEKNALLQIRSPHVVRLYEYIESVNQAYMVLELCDSGNFETIMICKQFNISVYEAIQYFKQIVKGMQAIHEKRIIHRDLKLNNILMKDNSTLKISDLGFCHLLSENENLVELNLGTIGSKAPEIMQNQPYGAQVDMFSAGVIFYQLLCDGAFPFPPLNEKQYLEDIMKGPETLEFYCKKIIPEKLKILIKSMLHYDPKVRLKWSDLFKNELFNQELKLDTFLGFNSRVDNVSCAEFYTSNENKLYSMVSPKFAQQTDNFKYELSNIQTQQEIRQAQQTNSSNQSKEITKYVSVLDIQNANDVLLQDQNKEMQQLNTFQDEINNLFENYLSIHRYLMIHRIAFELSHKVEFQSPRQIMYPVFLISKKVFELLQNLIKIVSDQDQNPFQSEKLEILRESQQWKVFYDELHKSKNQVYDLILAYKSTIKKNFSNMNAKQIQQYIEDEWLDELETYYPNQNFQKNYKACIERFINYLIQEIYSFGTKSKNQKMKQILIIHLIKCLTSTTIPSQEVSNLQIDLLLEDEKLLDKIFNENQELYFSMKN